MGRVVLGDCSPRALTDPDVRRDYGVKDCLIGSKAQNSVPLSSYPRVSAYPSSHLELTSRFRRDMIASFDVDGHSLLHCGRPLACRRSSQTEKKCQAAARPR